MVAETIDMTSPAEMPLSIVDLHSHLVPGVDDGTASVAESLDALAALHREDVRALVTTPHLLLPQLAGDEALDRELERHRRAYDELAASCKGREDLPWIALGQEIWAPDATAIRRVVQRSDIGLAGGRYLLVEFGFELLGSHNDVVREVQAAGRQTIIAHPERYHYLDGHNPVDVMRTWRDLGAMLQVNVGSLTGHYRRSSPASESLAWQMVELNLVDVISTDHHGPRRVGVSPREALNALIARGQRALAERAMMETPRMIARDEPAGSRLPR
jgi:protein-tyrosine phosphatase